MQRHKITANGKKIGSVLNGVFTKSVDPAKHRLRMFPAYGLSLEALHDLIGLGVTTVIIKERGGDKLKSSLEDWRSQDLKKMSLGGHDLQVFLPIDRMEVCKKKSKKNPQTA